MYYDAELDCWIFVAETDGILPDHVDGLVTVDKDGTNIMLINNHLSPKAVVYSKTKKSPRRSGSIIGEGRRTETLSNLLFKY